MRKGEDDDDGRLWFRRMKEGCMQGRAGRWYEQSSLRHGKKGQAISTTGFAVHEKSCRRFSVNGHAI